MLGVTRYYLWELQIINMGVMTLIFVGVTNIVIIILIESWGSYFCLRGGDKDKKAYK